MFPSFARAPKALGLIALAAASLTLALPATAAELPRSKVLITSAKSVDADAQTVTLPLFKGTAAGKTVWYIVTESSDKADASKRGVNYSPQLKDTGIAQHGKGDGTVLAFDGAPTFSAGRVFKPGPTGFPPAAANPGATSDGPYSPFVQLDSGIVLNAPIVATGDGPFDVTTHANTQARVLAVDTTAGTVKMLLARGFANGKPVVYISTEASDAGAATIERATFVPSLAKASATSKVPIFVFANGNGQGVGYVALQGHLNEQATLANAARLKSSMNILTTFPGNSTGAYTPIWEVNLGAYTAKAIAEKKNGVQKNTSDIVRLVGANLLTAPDGKPLGPTGIIVNCPVVAYLQGAP